MTGRIVSAFAVLFIAIQNARAEFQSQTPAVPAVERPVQSAANCPAPSNETIPWPRADDFLAMRHTGAPPASQVTIRLSDPAGSAEMFLWALGTVTVLGASRSIKRHGHSTVVKDGPARSGDHAISAADWLRLFQGWNVAVDVRPIIALSAARFEFSENLRGVPRFRQFLMQLDPRGPPR